MFSIRIYNKVSNKGLGLFQAEKYDVSDVADQPDAIVLRSHKLQGEMLPPSVKAIARAGAGTNNVPVKDCTERGVVVFNTPGANANAVKELVVAGLLLSSRGILSGKAFVDSLGAISDAGELARVLEKEKKRFAGNEIAGKCLGIVGLGAIGSLVANAALALGMRVVGFDPALSVEAAWRLPAEVDRMESLQALVAEVDYLSLHIPAVPATKDLINGDVLSLMKRKAVILNFAREAVVDAEAVQRQLQQGKLAGYVCDFPQPSLIAQPGVIALPHIGASTVEAEENCAVMAVNQVKDYLENGNIKNSVNFPETSMARSNPAYRLTFANRNVSGVLGDVLSVFAENDVNVVDMVNKSRGEVAYNILDLAQRPSPGIMQALESVEHVISLRLV